MKKYIASEIDVEREAAYRSGYYDGFWAALRTFDTVMNAGFTRDVAFEYCVEFWKTNLWEWVKSDLGSNSLAPEIVFENSNGHYHTINNIGVFKIE